MVPVEVTGLVGAMAVATGSHHTCALLSSGAVACWGGNGFGELGNWSTTSSSTPVVVTGIHDAVAVAASVEWSCAVLSGGAVECWGENDDAEIANGATTPVAVLGL